MNKLGLSLLVGALLVPAAVCTVNAQENNGNIAVPPLADAQKKQYQEIYKRVKMFEAEQQKAQEISLILEKKWDKDRLELANTIGKVKFYQDYQETMCTIYMALKKAGFENISITEPGIISCETDKLLTPEEKEELQKKYDSEVEELLGYKLEDSQKVPAIKNQNLSPVKITICVFQKWTFGQSRDARVPDGTVVNIYLEKADAFFHSLYPAAAEESYMKLIDLFCAEGLSFLGRARDNYNLNYFEKRKEWMERKKTAEQTVSEK